MKLKILILLLLWCIPFSGIAASHELTSPDGKLKVTVSCEGSLIYTMDYDGTRLIADSPVSMTLSDGRIWGHSPLKEVSVTHVDEDIETSLYRKSIVKDTYNELRLGFGDHDVVFRAYDDGFAWRFEASACRPYKVISEQAVFSFAEDWDIYASYTHKYASEGLHAQFMDDFENLYVNVPVSSWDRTRFGVLPLMVDCPDGIKMVIAESDLVSYPGMLLYNDGADSSVEGVFAPYPAAEVKGGHNMLQMLVTDRHDYIASCDGSARTFPWRSVSISTRDADMADNDMVYRLARPCPADEDFSWVKPGKVAWEWWNSRNIRGVDFVAGINNDTYEYYIDFASRHGLEYVILDEGWAVKYADDLFDVVPEIDIRKLVEYAAARNVGIILWAGYTAFSKDIEKVCRHYSEMGVKGFKVDFIDRNDQKVEDFVWEAAEIAARYGLLLDFHGFHQPTGLQRRFPNVVNYEGVFGLEQMRKRELPEYDMVEFDVTIPFIRFVAGFADYTPGAMRNATYENYRAVKREPMSQGTRCRQLAEFVVFDAPLNMLCDSPCNYEADPSCADFIYRVPTVWDETVVLDGKVADYIVTARRKGDVWFVGAMTDWTPRELEIDLSSLTGGKAEVECWQDGMSAYRFANDWQKKSFVTDGPVKISLASGGGWAAVVKKASDDGMRYVDALDLSLCCKLLPTDNPYHRVDVSDYGFVTDSEKRQIRQAAGLAVSFVTDSPEIGVKAVFGELQASESTGPLSMTGFDLYVRRDGKWQWAGSGSSGGSSSAVRLAGNMDDTMKECLLYLPLFSELKSVQIVIKDGASIERGNEPFAGRVAVFGSSFTNGASTSRPGMTWTAQLSRMTGIGFVNLGCSGNSRLQDYFADVLCDARADAFVFDVFSNPSPEEMAARLFPFIERVQSAHPGKPMIFLKSIYREKRRFNRRSESMESAKEHMADSLMRVAVRKYSDVYWVTATDATDHRHHDSSIDGTHLSDHGYTLWAESVCGPVTEILKKYGITALKSGLPSPLGFGLQAHRGLSARYPENSIPAFEQAGKAGVYYGMETDVQMTSDGILVCMHDNTIDRTTDHTGAVSDYTFEELNKVRLDSGTGWDDRYSGQLKIPTFREYLKICRRYSLVPYVELKLLTPEGVRKTVEMLHDMGFDGGYVLTSFQKDYLLEAAKYTDAPLEYMQSNFTLDKVEDCAGPYNFVIRPKGERLTEDFVRQARSKGFTVECYGIPVGDSSLVSKLKSWGVKGGTCNDFVGLTM